MYVMIDSCAGVLRSSLERRANVVHFSVILMRNKVYECVSGLYLFNNGYNVS